MFGVSGAVSVVEVDPSRRILMRWGEPTTDCEWTFQPEVDRRTVVTITERGYAGTADEIAARALDSTRGFTVVLCAAKALLEHGIDLGAVRDSHPEWRQQSD